MKQLKRQFEVAEEIRSDQSTLTGAEELKET